MRGIKNTNLYELKDQIESLTVSHQKAILKILVDSECIFTENTNGVFFDMKALGKENIHKIQDYVKFCKDTEENEKKRETEETELRIELKPES